MNKQNEKDDNHDGIQFKEIDDAASDEKKDDYVHNFKSITGISKRNPGRKKKKKKTIIEISLRVHELNRAKT